MKILKSMPVLLLAAFMATSCGSENSSGSGSSSTSGTVSGVVSTTGTSFSTIDEVRNSFDATSFSSGLTAGSFIVRGGSLHSTTSNSSNSSNSWFQISFSWNSGSSNPTDNQEILYVNSVSGDTVNVKEATDVQYSNYVYATAKNISRADSIYQEMLLRDGVQCSYIDIAAVTITLETISSNSYYGQAEQSTIQGTRIVCQENGLYSYSSSQSIYIVTNALPGVANPVYMKRADGETSYLSQIGTKMIKYIQ